MKIFLLNRAVVTLFTMFCLHLLVNSNIYAADFDAEVQSIWLSPATVYKGDTADVYARFKNLSSPSGPYGGYATFDMRIIINSPSGDSTYRCPTLKPSSADSVEFSLYAIKDFYWDNYTFNETGDYTIIAEIWQNNANPN